LTFFRLFFTIDFGAGREGWLGWGASDHVYILGCFLVLTDGVCC